MSKSHRRASFFERQPDAKKARKEERLALEILPAEIWKEIFTYLNKRDLRNLGVTCPAFYPITQELFLDASWPAIDYRQFHPEKTARVKYLAPQEYFPDVKDRYLFTLQNGDAALALENGRLYVLRLRESIWQLFGSHEHLQRSGKMRGFQAKDVVALNSSEIASCAQDGVRIWDRMSGSQKQHIILPDVGSWASRPKSFLRLSNHRFVTGCWDGSLYIWHRAGNEYQHERTLYLGDDQELHVLNKLKFINAEIVAEYSQFIARWDSQGKLLARIELADLKKQLISLLPDPEDVSKERSSLKFYWSFPSGYVGVKLNSHFFIVNIAGNGTKPRYVASDFSYIIKHKVTHSGDIVVIVENPFSQEMCVLGGWNQNINKFAFSCLVRTDPGSYLILNNGFIFNDYQLSLFDPYQNHEVEFDLHIPRDEPYPLSFKRQLQNGDLLATTQCDHEALIFDLTTGRCKARLDLHTWDMQELPNGDLFNHKRELGGIYPYPEYDNKDTDHVEIFRFGLRK